MKITRQQFIDIVAATKADKIVVRYESDVKMNKKDNPFFHKEGRSWIPDHAVTKVSTSQYLFGKNYSQAVNEAAKAATEKDVDFKAKDSYLETVIPDKLYKSKTDDKLYLRVMPDSSSEFVPTYEYLVDGKPADEAQMKIIDEWETKRDHAVHTQEAVGIEDFVRVFNYKLENIKAVSIDGETYEL